MAVVKVKHLSIDFENHLLPNAIKGANFKGQVLGNFVEIEIPTRFYRDVKSEVLKRVYSHAFIFGHKTIKRYIKKDYVIILGFDNEFLRID